MNPTPTYRCVKTREGWCWLVALGDKLVRCALPVGSKSEATASVAREFPEATEDRTLLPELARDLQAYFRGEAVRFKVTLSFDGVTDFQRDVYKALRKVPWGRTVSYGELAERAGRPGAARGVGTAMARNPCPPVIPCHRVLASNGGMAGFSAPGGVRLKALMLGLEQGEGSSGSAAANS